MTNRPGFVQLKDGTTYGFKEAYVMQNGWLSVESTTSTKVINPSEILLIHFDHAAEEGADVSVVEG